MRESVIETLTVANWVAAGNVTGAALSDTITGVGFNALYANINIAQVLMFTDDAGRFQCYTVKSLTNDTTIVLHTPLKTAVTAKAGFTQNYHSSPWFIQPDPLLATLRPDRSLIFGSASSNLYGGTNFFAGGTGLYELQRLFSVNEGVLLKSLYVTLPYQYTMGMNGLTLEVRYVNTNNQSTHVAAIGTLGRFQIPIENQEIEINQFVPVPLQAVTGIDTSAGWGLGISILDAEQAPVSSEYVFDITTRFGSSFPSVSRELAPNSTTDKNADLDNTFLPIRIGARVVHLNALTAAAVDDVST